VVFGEMDWLLFHDEIEFVADKDNTFLRFMTELVNNADSSFAIGEILVHVFFHLLFE